MAHLIRGKQAGIQGDFSAGIGPEFVALDDINRYGIGSQVSAIAYDPIQSLLAVGTNETKFGEGQIYLFGQKRVSAIFQLQRRGSVRSLKFCADKLICFDSRNDLSVFSLETKRMISSYSPPGTVFSIYIDPSLDYVLLGMQSGDVLAFDVEHGKMAPFQIPCFWREFDPRARAAPIMALALHPRDLGTLLIGYAEGCVTYSFKQNKALKFFRYEVPRGAPGGDGNTLNSNVIRHPRLTHAVWHPTGTFILTGHEDGSLVFWDAKDGRIVMARTLTETNIDKPGTGTTGVGAGVGGGEKEPLFKIIWCANQDPEDTAILISGGASSTSPAKGLTLLELGRTPNYQTSGWQVLSQYIESPKRQRMLPIPPDTEVVDFCMIPRTSPHFDGASDPIAIMAVLASGEIITMSFPSGYPISSTNQLHVSLTFVHPFITSINLSPIERGKWLGLVEKRTMGPPILQGGAEAKRPMKRFENRNIVHTAHADGTVRLWDAGHGDEVENECVLQVDVDRAIGRPEGIEIILTSLSGAAGELAVGTRTGDVALFRWNHNRLAGREPMEGGPGRPGELVDIANRADSALVDGLLPFTMVHMQNGPVTALKLSDVGFLAAGFEGGGLIVIDLRGPAIIYNGNVQEFAQSGKRPSGRQGNVQAVRDFATAMEFSVMTLEGESWSSISLHVGTSLGSVATFKIIPQGGRYAVQLAGSVANDGRIVNISPISADTGNPTYASQPAVAGLRDGRKVNGTLLAVSQHGARISKPALGKGAHKSWDHFVVESAAVARCEDKGVALITLSHDGFARAFSIPALREIGSVQLSNVLDPQRFRDAVITATGDIFGWVGPAETALVNIWGRGLVLNRSKDTLFNPAQLVPPRPTISNVQWLSGTQHVTAADIDLLIGGPERPPTKRALSTEQVPGAAQPRAGQAGASGQDEGYWAYMQRQVQERTERLNILGDSVNKLEETSSSWASEAGKYVQKTKRNLVMGAVKGKFGL